MWSKLLSPERRREPRYRAAIPATVIFLGTGSRGDRPLAALGQTRDLSANGLALYVPAFPFAGGVLTAEQRALRVELVLPAGRVAVAAELVRHEALPSSHPEVGHLVAAHIAAFEGGGRAPYDEYLKLLTAAPGGY